MRTFLSWPLLAAAFAACAAEPPVESTPSTLLTVTSEGLVFFPGERQIVPFTFTAPGGATLAVTRVEASCSCMVPGGIPVRLEPGAPVHAAVMITAGRLAGGFGGTVWVWSRAGEEAERIIALSASGEVRDPLGWPAELSGPLLDLGSCRSQEAVQPRRFRLVRGPHPLPWTTISVDSGDDGQFHAEVQAAGAGWDLVVTPASPRFHGQLNGRLVFTLRAADGNVLPYQPERALRLRVVGPVVAKPLGLLLGVVAAGGMAEASSVLSTADGAPIVVRTLTVSDPARMHAQVALVDGEQVLSLAFTATGKPGKASGHVDVGFADGSVMRLPVLATVAAAGPP
jgi:hypothetical protein